MSLLTVREVASLLRVSSATIQRLIRVGDLPATRIGRQARIDSSDFARYLQSNCNQKTVDGDVAESGSVN